MSKWQGYGTCGTDTPGCKVMKRQRWQLQPSVTGCEGCSRSRATIDVVHPLHAIQLAGRTTRP